MVTFIKNNRVDCFCRGSDLYLALYVGQYSPYPWVIFRAGSMSQYLFHLNVIFRVGCRSLHSLDPWVIFRSVCRSQYSHDLLVIQNHYIWGLGNNAVKKYCTEFAVGTWNIAMWDVDKFVNSIFMRQCNKRHDKVVGRDVFTLHMFYCIYTDITNRLTLCRLMRLNVTVIGPLSLRYSWEADSMTKWFFCCRKFCGH